MGLNLQNMEANESRSKAVCLFSGGLDSTTALYFAIGEGCVPLALTIDYGQLHKRELESAEKIAHHLQIEHQVISIQLPWGGSALLDPTIPIPDNQSAAQIPDEIPATYVPARNTIFLSFAASFAEARGAEAILIGANQLDYSGYPDCRSEYFSQFNTLLRLGTKQGFEGKALAIVAPLVRMSKAEIVRLGHELGIPFEWTWSCYRGGEIPCMRCDACLLRAKGFQEAGVKDPLIESLIGYERS